MYEPMGKAICASLIGVALMIQPLTTLAQDENNNEGADQK